MSGSFVLVGNRDTLARLALGQLGLKGVSSQEVLLFQNLHDNSIENIEERLFSQRGREGYALGFK